MKRTPLNRKTPLKRKAPLKKISSKKRQEIKETSGPRKLYREAKKICPLCGVNCSEVHEIARGPSRHQSVRDSDNWLAICHNCHEEKLGDYEQWPIEKQIALKWLVVLDAVNGCRSGRRQSDLNSVLEQLKSLTD